jgi:fructoselysine-6-P-deglycase FrlB-like protein
LAGSNDCSKLGGMEPFESDIVRIRNMVLVGCGSSNQAAMSVLPLFKKMRLFSSVAVVEGSEFT